MLPTSGSGGRGRSRERTWAGFLPVVYRPVVEGRRFTFRAEGDSLVDAETGSRWTLLGHATAGPLAGRQLEPVVSANHFWFAWAAFKPDTRVYQAP